MKSFLRQIKQLDSKKLKPPTRKSSVSFLYSLLPFILIFSPTLTKAAPLTSTDIYVLSGASTTTVNQVKTLNTATGALSSTLFTAGVSNSAALGMDPINLQLYYSDRTLTPNNLKRHNGTTESASLGTFSGSDNSSVPILRMGFRGSTGYAISNNNTMYTFTNGTSPTITSLGLLSFIGTNPSGATSSGDIAFDGYGYGWAIFGNSLYRLNLTGSLREAIPIGQLTVNGVPLVVASAANNNTGAIIGSIAFDSLGDLYVAGITLSAGTTTGTTIYRVNIDDGTAVQVGSLISGVTISDFASANQPLIAPNIQATKTVSPTSGVMPGDTLTYTIEIENTGTAPAVNLDFSDVLPAGTTYVPNSAALNGTSLAAATYPFATAYRINGRNASSGTIKSGYNNRATVTFQVTVNTSNVPTSITNQGTVIYLDGPGNIPTTSAVTPVLSPVSGYKSAKLTNDADGSGTITPGDTVTWTISYKNASTTVVNNFQINDPLPTGVTLSSTGSQTVTVSGAGTSALKNTSYTGAATGSISDLLAASATLGSSGVVTITIPTIVNSGFIGVLSNQPNATGSSIPGTGTLTDNVDNTSSVPSGVTVPLGSITQAQAPTTDPTIVTVVLPPVVTLSGTVFDDADGSKVLNGSESGVNAGGLNAVLIDSTNKVLATVPVAANGIYSFPPVPANANYTIQITDATATVGLAPPAVSLPSTWVSTGENLNGTIDSLVDSKQTIAVTTSNITGINFGIEQLPNTTDLTSTSQTNPGGTTTVQVPTLTGTDPEDGGLGNGKTFKIITLPTMATLYYNGAAVIVGQLIQNYDPTKLTIDPNDGAVTVTFTYAAIDVAGKQDPTPATITMPFTASIVTNPELLLVKRITAINGDRDKNPNDNTVLNLFVDDITSPKKNEDNNPNWVTGYLQGAIDGGKVKPGDEIEYTIYFLSAGNAPVKKLSFCDLVPGNTTFSPNGFGFGQGIQLAIGSLLTTLTNVPDNDKGEFFVPNATPSATCSNTNTNGAVVVNVVQGTEQLSNAVSSGTPGDSYGFVRFKAKAK